MNRSDVSPQNENVRFVVTLGCVERESLRSFCLTDPGRLPRLVRIPRRTPPWFT